MMASLAAIVHCPRCRSRSTVQSAIELRPGVEYLTLRCACCGLLYDGQVPSEPKKVSTSGKAKPSPSKGRGDDTPLPVKMMLRRFRFSQDFVKADQPQDNGKKSEGRPKQRASRKYDPKAKRGNSQ
jgi:rubredoxin